MVDSGRGKRRRRGPLNTGAHLPVHLHFWAPPPRLDQHFPPPFEDRGTGAAAKRGRQSYNRRWAGRGDSSRSVCTCQSRTL